MLKFKCYFKCWLTAITCLLQYHAVSAKDLDFSSLSSCKSDTQQYVINYDNVGELEWIVEGGHIISLDGRNESLTSQQMFGAYMGTQWYTIGNHNTPFDASDTYAYTRIKFDGNKRMEVTCYVPTNTSPYLFNGSDHATHSPTLANNPLKKITVVWSPNAFKRTIKCKGDGLGAIGFLTGESGEVEKTIQVYKPVPSITVNPYNPNVTCTHGIQLDGVPYDDTYYKNTWSVPGGVVSNNWNSGIYIDHFTDAGIIPVTVTISNVCGESVTKQINLNVFQPDFGHVMQNGNNVDVPGSLVSLDCQGNFNLGIPWFSNNAIYTWELPGTSYDSQTNTYAKTTVSGVNKLNIQGKLPTGGYTDFVGKVIITGVCGAPVVKTFIIRPALRPTVDTDIYSCTNSVLIPVNNPTATGNINAWVRSTTPLNLQASITDPTPTSVLFTAASKGTYYVTIDINGAGGCNTRLETTVHTGTVGQNPTANTTGWQSGVLSDNRKAAGSNIVTYGGNIYFSGRDGKMYFYSFSTALQKWVINEIPGVTNAAIPAGGAFTRIDAAMIGTENYLFFTNSDGFFRKLNLATNVVDAGLGATTQSNNFIVSNNEIYVFVPSINQLLSNQFSATTLVNISLKTRVTGYGVAYQQNNNLFVTGIGQLTATADVYASSDVVYYNGWLYYARGQKGSANLYRMQVSTPGSAQQVTTSSNLSGIFTINPVSGVIYYGVMNLGTANTIGTQTSGSFTAADVYQAHVSGTTWVLNKATTVVNYEGLDMLIHSAVYSGNHLYYVGAGRNKATGNTTRELEVWNLYYENGCAPVLQRVGADVEVPAENTDVRVYPNPFNTELLIDLSAYSEEGNITAVAVEVIDAAGKSIYKGTLLSELTAISTADWMAGMYVMKINYNNKLTNKKVVKY